MYHYYCVDYNPTFEECEICESVCETNTLDEIRQMLLQHTDFLYLWAKIWYTHRKNEQFVKLWLDCYPQRPILESMNGHSPDFIPIEGNFPDYYDCFRLVNSIREITHMPILLPSKKYNVVSFDEKYKRDREFFVLNGDEEDINIWECLVGDHLSFNIVESNHNDPSENRPPVRHCDYSYMVESQYYCNSHFYHFISEDDLEKLVDSDLEQITEVTLTLVQDWQSRKDNHYLFKDSSTRFYSKELRIAALPFVDKEYNELCSIIKYDPDEDVRNIALQLFKKQHPYDWESLLK